MTTLTHTLTDLAWGEATPEPLNWVSGPWQISIRSDKLDYITFNGAVVLRSIRAVIRDRDWCTVPVSVIDRVVSNSRARLGLRFAGLGAQFDAVLTVQSSDTELEVELTVQALQDFERNRIGLVVLHPLGLAGSALEVTSPNGARTNTVFPLAISPHQPATEIAQLSWRADGAIRTLKFLGDVFEMEDQRNWTDASYKTYSTPLSKPFPVHVDAGERIVQSIRLHCGPTIKRSRHHAESKVALSRQPRRFPQFGVAASTAPGNPPAERPILGTSLLVELDARSDIWTQALARALEEREDLPLDVRIVTNDSSDLYRVIHRLSQLPKGSVARVGAFSPITHVSDERQWLALKSATEALSWRVELVGGTRAHFTELNRSSNLLPDEIESLAFSITPQMHSTERDQIIESIQVQRRVAIDATHIAGGRKLHIGPISLRPRFNAVATTSSPVDRLSILTSGYGAQLVLSSSDVRQDSTALAAWTVASAAALSVEGVDSITYFETWGDRGLARHDGDPRPVVQAFRWLAELSGKDMLSAEVATPNLWALGGMDQYRCVVLVSNLSEETVEASLVDPYDPEQSHRISIPPFSASRYAFSDKTGPAPSARE